ncbi:hypothetical protein [Glaciimonas soli]|uniref:Uncharacterized protein n=1 Tax=Glaciimonas soli TaxID=2590999 RepID=A0A843YPQ4_9BURK|nr:hypothetical protein [Glaciimonas soli]MQR01779.1 hypothetical protein [Glaciimonas soli]
MNKDIRNLPWHSAIAAIAAGLVVSAVFRDRWADQDWKIVDSIFQSSLFSCIAFIAAQKQIASGVKDYRPLRFQMAFFAACAIVSLIAMNLCVSLVKDLLSFLQLRSAAIPYPEVISAFQVIVFYPVLAISIAASWKFAAILFLGRGEIKAHATNVNSTASLELAWIIFCLNMIAQIAVPSWTSKGVVSVDNVALPWCVLATSGLFSLLAYLAARVSLPKLITRPRHFRLLLASVFALAFSCCATRSAWYLVTHFYSARITDLLRFSSEFPLSAALGFQAAMSVLAIPVLMGSLWLLFRHRKFT